MPARVPGKLKQANQELRAAGGELDLVGLDLSDAGIRLGDVGLDASYGNRVVRRLGHGEAGVQGREVGTECLEAKALSRLVVGGADALQRVRCFGG